MNDAPRLRSVQNVDLTKADPRCPKCKGTGVSGTQTIEDPEQPGRKIGVRVVCKCVVSSGGVKKDELDRLVEDFSKSLNDGRFAESFASDILNLDDAAKNRAISQLQSDLIAGTKSDEALSAIAKTLRILAQKEKEVQHGNA